MKPFFATPAYTGDVSIRHRTFCLGMQAALLKLGIEPIFGDIVGGCYLPWVRSELVRMFLETDCTHLVFVDGDMAFNVDDFMRMLSFSEDKKYKVIAAGYPMRKLDWGQIRYAAHNPDVSLDVLARAGQQWTLHPLKDEAECNLNEPFEVAEIGTGGMVIQREVLGVMPAPYFETKWTSEGEFQGEDYLFCRRYRSLGGQIWMAPWVRSIHVGRYEFQGDIKMMDEAHSTKEEVCR